MMAIRFYEQAFPTKKVGEIRQLQDRFDLDTTHSKQVCRLAMSIFDQLQTYHGCDSKYRLYLFAGSMLHDIGHCIGGQKHHKHSRKLILKYGIPGFDPTEKKAVALIARYHRKKTPKKSHHKFASLPAEWRQFVRVASAVLRIADGMDRNRQSAVKNVTVSVKNGKAKFIMTGAVNMSVDIWGAERKKKFFEKVFHLKATFTAGGNNGDT
jgi:exopolyphosphatase/guanosine-5'-triphosphate,3'-diphosphate pyrophosphatase